MLDEPELDDFLSFSTLPATTQLALEQRQEWVRRLARDGVRLGEWEREKKEGEKRERREKKEREEERKRQQKLGARREDYIDGEEDK